MNKLQSLQKIKGKICLLSDHHLCINPRLWKEAFFYEQEGYEVVVLTMWLSNDLLQRDEEILKGHAIKYKSYLSLIPGEVNPVLRFFYRVRKKAAAELQRYLKIGTGWAISHAPELLVKKALHENADIYSAHLECGFFAGRELVKAGKKVCFDFEDWYSRDYLTSDRAVGLLSKLEAFALMHGVFCTAASQAMATALQRDYAINKDITVVYNSFPDEPTDESFLNVADVAALTDNIHLVWTSRTVGPDRGLETFVKALAYTDTPVVLTLIGKSIEGYQQSLQALLPSDKRHQLIFIDFISHNELMNLLSGFDFGLALEKKYPANKNTTISNKILQYLQVNIAVLATDTDGQKEVATSFPDSVFLLSTEDPGMWADQLSTAIAQKKKIDKTRQQQIYQEQFSWTRQEETLKALISAHL